ncbi:MAG: hypothetical protein LBH42_01475, partial [Treponema sp.]|nr:hypothetical protein [Treponema sp.]
MKAKSPLTLFRFLNIVILFGLVFPVSCQTPGAGPPAAVDQPVWNGVPGEFKAAVLGTLKPGDPFVVTAAGTGIPLSNTGSGGSKDNILMHAILRMGDRQL